MNNKQFKLTLSIVILRQYECGVLIVRFTGQNKEDKINQ